MGTTVVGVREAKNRFSELTADANRTGSSVTVLKNNKPWVMIVPVDEASRRRAELLERFHALTALIEGDAERPVWDADVSDRELLGAERVRRFG